MEENIVRFQTGCGILGRIRREHDPGGTLRGSWEMMCWLVGQSGSVPLTLVR